MRRAESAEPKTASNFSRVFNESGYTAETRAGKPSIIPIADLGTSGGGVLRSRLRRRALRRRRLRRWVLRQACPGRNNEECGNDERGRSFVHVEIPFAAVGE